MKILKFFKESVPDKILDIHNSDTIFIYRKRKINVTKHSEDRKKLRSLLTEKEWATFFRRVIDRVILLKSKRIEEILFFSKQFNQGIIVINKPMHNTIILKTILPQSNSRAGFNTSRVFVEQHPQNEIVYSREFIDYITNLNGYPIIINESDSIYCYDTRTIKYKNGEFDIILCENMYRHLDISVEEIK